MTYASDVHDACVTRQRRGYNDTKTSRSALEVHSLSTATLYTHTIVSQLSRYILQSHLVLFFRVILNLLITWMLR